MDRVLLVEDAKTVSRFLEKPLLEAGLEMVQAFSLAESQQILREDVDGFFVAILDLNLPDCEPLEVVESIHKAGIPSIVFTGNFDDRIQDMVWSNDVVDYVVKSGRGSIGYVVDLIKRVRSNRKIEVLVVDDSMVARRLITRLLKIHQYIVHDASNGVEALEVLKAHPNIRMVITDFNMPRVDGFDLTQEIRAQHDKREPTIIGVSAQGDNRLSAHFLKNGANDFINKPFSTDEFYCRVTQNIEMIEYVREIRDVSLKDYLTGLGNRRYFFERCPEIYERANSGSAKMAIGMIDVDHFKRFNDTYSHDAGDSVLQHVAALLEAHCAADEIVARFGGEEFCVLSNERPVSELVRFYDSLRSVIANSHVLIEGEKLSVTVSIGITTEPLDSIDEMLNAADERLYEAKNNGRNRIMLAS